MFFKSSSIFWHRIKAFSLSKIIIEGEFDIRLLIPKANKRRRRRWEEIYGVVFLQYVSVNRLRISVKDLVEEAEFWIEY